MKKQVTPQAIPVRRKPLLLYLADLYHDYLPTRQHVPLGIGYIASYAISMLGDAVQIELFKSADRLLDRIESQPPDLLGLSNYTWNVELNQRVLREIQSLGAEIPVFMGGPNIKTDDRGILAFLQGSPFVDRYILYAAEKPALEIVQGMLSCPEGASAKRYLRGLNLSSSHTLVDGVLEGGSEVGSERALDHLPSPYLTGLMDPFLKEGALPIIETNRGCPFSS
ncbi:MAG: cobalamin B12-binding domain-containing protein, partial [Magnetococcales bacterium]|nr:cobalamin B12-binding domain-containing protein [Magnetococcales bacterium]